MAPRLPPGMAQSHVFLHVCRFMSVASCYSHSFLARHPTAFADGWSFNAPIFSKAATSISLRFTSAVILSLTLTTLAVTPSVERWPVPISVHSETRFCSLRATVSSRQPFGFCLLVSHV